MATTLVAQAKDTQAALVLEEWTPMRSRLTVRTSQRHRQNGWGCAHLRACIA